MRLVLLGLPGAGKGTQGERISEKYQIPHISTGSIIREAIASGSTLGVEANGFIRHGNLIPDHLAIAMVVERLVRPDCKDGWILDGFPRTVKQAICLDSQLAEDNSGVDVAFDIRISEAEAIRRVIERRVCSNCGAIYHLRYYRAQGKGVCDQCQGDLIQRSDDNEDTARTRLRVYMRQTHPVLHYYAQSGRLFSVFGERPIDQVFRDVDHILDSRVAKKCVGGSQ